MPVFTTDDCRPHERFDHWRALRARSLFGVTAELPPERRASFRGEIKLTHVGSAAIVELRACPYQVQRGAGDIARSSGNALANSDDAAWIKKCVADNKDEGQSAAVIASYCSCMNNKMSDSETLSISAWEKTHPDEQEACSKEAGWGK